MNNSIKSILTNGLCTACGLCKSICPVNAIHMRENGAGFLTANIDESICTNCSLCKKSCPSVTDNDVSSGFDDCFTGNVLSAFIGYAMDNKIRLSSQSGGVVSGLLTFLLDTKKIEVAYGNAFNKDTKRPVVAAMHNRDDVLRCCGSYYAASAMLENILSPDVNNKKKAMVLLGCQSEALFLLEKNSKFYNPVDYKIGLFCAGQNSAYMIDDLIKKSQIKEDPQFFRFRDKTAGGWPGKVKLSGLNEVKTLPTVERAKLKLFYNRYRCSLCFDQMNIYSDIAVGDPWGIKLDDEEKGYTVVLARTQKGLDLLNDAAQAGYIKIKSIPAHDIISGQSVNLKCKNRVFQAQQYLARNSLTNIVNALPGIDERLEMLDKRYFSRYMQTRLRWEKEMYLKTSKKESLKYTDKIQKKYNTLLKMKKLIAIIRAVFRILPNVKIKG